MVGRAEGGGDGGCIEVSSSDPMRDLFCQGLVGDEPGVVRALQRSYRETSEHGRVADLRDAVSRTTSSRACGDGGLPSRTEEKRTCRAAADVGFRYSTVARAEGGGDECCTEPSELDP